MYPASIRWVAQWYPSVHWVNQWRSSGIPVYAGPASVHWLRVRVTGILVVLVPYYEVSRKDMGRWFHNIIIIVRDTEPLNIYTSIWILPMKNIFIWDSPLLVSINFNPSMKKWKNSLSNFCSYIIELLQLHDTIRIEWNYTWIHYNIAIRSHLME